MNRVGELIHELRTARGWSQGRLAEELCALSGRSTVTREEVSRWERGRRCPGPFWLPHLAAALRAPRSVLDAELVRRRTFLTAVAFVPAAMQDTSGDLMSSIANGDSGPLGTVQTSHLADLRLAGLTGQDRASMLHLVRWMEGGETDVLRVNAAGIVAKNKTSPELVDMVPVALACDAGARKRYVAALVARVGNDVSTLSREVLNPRDAGARWCSALLLGQHDESAARRALETALRSEPVRENVRAMALVLQGADPCT